MSSKVSDQHGQIYESVEEWKGLIDFSRLTVPATDSEDDQGSCLHSLGKS